MKSPRQAPSTKFLVGGHFSNTLACLVAIVGVLLSGGPLAGAARADSSPSPSPSSSSSLPAGASDPSLVTFGVQPASPTKSGLIAPDPRPYLYYAASPGSTIRDHVAILNYSTKPIRLSVYSTDALNDDKGGFALLQGSEKPTDAGAWTSLSARRQTITVPSRTTLANGQQVIGSVILPITIHVPTNATPGDHSAGVLASFITSSDSATGANVKLDQRVGTRMFVRVSGPLSVGVSVENVSATYNGALNPLSKGSATVRFTVANHGNVKLGGRLKVDVSGLLGMTSSLNLPDLPLLLPGNAIEISAVVSDVVPQVRDTATVTLTPLKLQSDADPPLPDVTGSASFWAIPWTLIGSLLVLLLLAWYLWNRRRGDLEDIPEPNTGTESYAHAV